MGMMHQLIVGTVRNNRNPVNLLAIVWGKRTVWWWARIISDWQSWWWRWFQPISIAMMELTVLAAIGWHNRLRMTNLQYCPEPTLFCFLPGVSWRANHQSCHWCRKRYIVSRIAILLHCRIGDLLSPLSSARLWCLVSVLRWKWRTIRLRQRTLIHTLILC